MTRICFGLGAFHTETAEVHINIDPILMTDALTDILDSIRMRGSVFSRAALDAPWGIESGVTGNGVFHAVVRGRAWAQLADGGPSVELERGDVVLMPFGDNHLITDEPSRLTRPARLANSGATTRARQTQLSRLLSKPTMTEH